MWAGPQPQSHAARLQIVDRIVADLHRTYGDRIQAMALYGSMSRGTDDAYSDVELWCVLNTPGLDTSEEWIYGPSKAEVNFYGVDVAQARTILVTYDWSLRQGKWLNNHPLFGDRAYFEALRARVMSPPKHVFDDVIAEIVVGEFFEWMGKIRNGVARDDLDFLPITTCNFTLHMALMVALAHRHVYSTSRVLMREALALPTLPVGYRELVQMVMAGELHDKPRVVAALEATWAGLEGWLMQQEIALDARVARPWA